MPKSRATTAATVFAAAIAMSTVLSGCKSASSTSAGSGPSAAAAGSTASASQSVTPAAPTTTSPPAAGGGGGGGKQINVCTVLSLSAVTSATGRAYTTATPTSLTSPAPGNNCRYDGADESLLSMDVTVFYSNPDAAYQAMQGSSQAAGETTTDVSGFGDKAYSDEDELAVVFGSTTIFIQDAEIPPGVKPLGLPLMEQFATTVHAMM